MPIFDEIFYLDRSASHDSTDATSLSAFQRECKNLGNALKESPAEHKQAIFIDEFGSSTYHKDQLKILEGLMSFVAEHPNIKLFLATHSEGILGKVENNPNTTIYHVKPKTFKLVKGIVSEDSLAQARELGMPESFCKDVELFLSGGNLKVQRVQARQYRAIEPYTEKERTSLKENVPADLTRHYVGGKRGEPFVKVLPIGSTTTFNLQAQRQHDGPLGDEFQKWLGLMDRNSSPQCIPRVLERLSDRQLGQSLNFRVQPKLWFREASTAVKQFAQLDQNLSELLDLNSTICYDAIGDTLKIQNNFILALWLHKTNQGDSRLVKKFLQAFKTIAYGQLRSSDREWLSRHDTGFTQLSDAELSKFINSHLKKGEPKTSPNRIDLYEASRTLHPAFQKMIAELPAFAFHQVPSDCYPLLSELIQRAQANVMQDGFYLDESYVDSKVNSATGAVLALLNSEEHFNDILQELRRSESVDSHELQNSILNKLAVCLDSDTLKEPHELFLEKVEQLKAFSASIPKALSEALEILKKPQHAFIRKIEACMKKVAVEENLSEDEQEFIDDLKKYISSGKLEDLTDRMLEAYEHGITYIDEDSSRVEDEEREEVSTKQIKDEIDTLLGDYSEENKKIKSALSSIGVSIDPEQTYYHYELQKIFENELKEKFHKEALKPEAVSLESEFSLIEQLIQLNLISQARTTPVSLNTNGAISVTRMIDPSFNENRAKTRFIPLSFETTERQTKQIIVGPNGSGKSVWEQALRLNASLANLTGEACGDSLELPSFSREISLLRVSGKSSNLSSGQSEIKYFIDIINSLEAGQKVLLLWDEPFSTLPTKYQEAFTAAAIKLLTEKGIDFQIAFHTHDLEAYIQKQFPDILFWHMDYQIQEDGTLKYLYKPKVGLAPSEGIAVASKFFPPEFMKHIRS